MRSKISLAVLIIISLSVSFVAPVSGETLQVTDFKKENFTKIVDYFDYTRAWAALHGLPEPPDDWHAYVYMNYINKTGLQMLYAGLLNISLADSSFLTIPMQTILLHYKTEQNGRDALVASSFMMLMGFNDTSKSIYYDSPDRNDTLWASFSFGVNLEQIFPNLNLPSFSSKSEIYPLSSSEDELTWKWGMKYTNLTALWITTYITEENETDTGRPWGLATYDELTFNYTLTIDPQNNKATISQDHVIGRIRDLWTFGGWYLIWPIYNHYNSTGCYRYGAKVSDKNLYEFLFENNVKMSIVEYQTSVMLDRNTYSATTSGQNVTDNEVFVSDSTISTYAEDGEKIFDAAFGVKETYNLFNYTKDATETTPQICDAVTRTSQIGGLSKNLNLFRYHRQFVRYLPLVLIHMYPKLYQRAKEAITDMTRVDYLFIISYPNYSGYRIEHDPVYTVYFAPTTLATGPNLGSFILIAVIATSIGMAFVLLRKRSSIHG